VILTSIVFCEAVECDMIDELGLGSILELESFEIL